ncbi:hypothetical protein SAMN04487944_12619 [Gracilibacillus ureilyticus]|uniref:Uncharacterized protein n=1 Tax=Gracilibacillus ureilyticus TaxID=531814 RepID=A0A1H9VQI5_9BACI|nr:hypothetical protein [Gracilibacillus ureilyticus]SES23852.1 hypothetical protein SAMN04487944_12619 [Gracilibacillus ureilyticus]
MKKSLLFWTLPGLVYFLVMIIIDIFRNQPIDYLGNLIQTAFIVIFFRLCYWAEGHLRKKDKESS